MSTKVKITAQKSDEGRFNWIKIYKGRRKKPLRLDFVYSSLDGSVRDIEFSGRKRDMPKIDKLISLFLEASVREVKEVQTVLTEIIPFGLGFTVGYDTSSTTYVEKWRTTLSPSFVTKIILRMFSHAVVKMVVTGGAVWAKLEAGDGANPSSWTNLGDVSSNSATYETVTFADNCYIPAVGTKEITVRILIRVSSVIETGTVIINKGASYGDFKIQR